MARAVEGLQVGQAAFDHITNVLRSLNASIADIQAAWARRLGLSVPQWNILLTISAAQDDAGISIKSIAKVLRVDPSFVTTQSKSMEAKDFLKRRTSSADKRVVYLSLTPKARRELVRVAGTRNMVDDAIIEKLGEGEISRVLKSLRSLDTCLAMCPLRIKLADRQ